MLFPGSITVRHAVTFADSKGPTERRLRPGVCAFHLVHFILLALFSVYLAVCLFHSIHDTYLWPQMELMHFSEERKTREVTYFQRFCDKDDITARTYDELMIQPGFSAKDAMEHSVRHGVSVFPQILRNETADALRKFVLDNKNTNKLPGIFVLAPEHRFSASFTVDEDPSILQASKEVATHPTLRPALDTILGPNAAVIEFSVISVGYGASTQEWHADTNVDASAMKYGRSFAPSYSLFIPLQDTTEDMGSTELCPGSHVCHWDYPFCFTGRGSMQVKDGSKSDLWPKGYGALMNQQLQHRGTSHSDEYGGERVMVVISFAPRPRWGPRELETRLVSLGSTFSIKWDHWGHTLDDFAEASSRMRQPWRTLRALGFYTLKGNVWGWDLPTMTCMRLVNEAYSYYRPDERDEFIESGGIQFLPKSFHAEITEGDDWHSYYLKTFIRCERFLKWLTLAATCGFLAFCSLLDTIRRLFRKAGCEGSTTLSTLLKLTVSYGLLVLVANAIWIKVCGSMWAKSISGGQLYNLGQVTDPGWVLGTLPYMPDVLLETRYNSLYLHAYNRMLDITHPGNRQFHRMIRENAVGYTALPPAMQRHLAANLAGRQRERGGRLLSQTDSGTWYEMSSEQALRVCRLELSKASSSLLETLINEVGFLASEKKFGPLRDATMHRTHISSLLSRLQEKLVDATQTRRDIGLRPSTNDSACMSARSRPENCKLRGIEQSLRQLHGEPTVRKEATVARFEFWYIRSLALTGPTKRPPHPMVRLLTLPSHSITNEPYLGAWLKQGDVVDAKYRGKYGWYEARIMSVNADTTTYNVQHTDGDTDEDLRRMWVRPYSPLEVGEVLEVRTSSSGYERASVTNTNEDGTVNVVVHDEGLILKQVASQDVFRLHDDYEVGSYVEVCQVDRDSDDFVDDGMWWSARVLRANDGLYDVSFYGYSSGIKNDVHPNRIRPLQR